LRDHADFRECLAALDPETPGKRLH
jgi:hypothetical protein